MASSAFLRRFGLPLSHSYSPFASLSSASLPLFRASLSPILESARSYSDGRFSRPFRSQGSQGSIEGNEELRLTTTVVDVHQTVKVTKGGKVRKYSVLVLCGNGKGIAGFGVGKGDDFVAARSKAEKHARKDLAAVELDGSTLPHDIKETYGKTEILLRAANPGAGLRTNPVLRAVLQSFGYQDVVGKCFGSRNKLNQVRAAFQALTTIETAEEIAKRRGRVALPLN